MPDRREVPKSAELSRILALPSRDWAEYGDNFARDTSALLRSRPACVGTPAGAKVCRCGVPLELFPIQAAALYDLVECGGLLGPMPVGSGKTLVSLLAPRVLGAQRPLLILPKKLIEKTKREWIELLRHWQIPRFIKLMGAEYLGRAQAKFEIEQFGPDLIGVDEAHMFKDPSASRTKKLERALERDDAPPAYFLSGTFTSVSLKEYAHLANWALRDQSPVPRTWHVLESWANALDERDVLTGGRRTNPGALKAMLRADEAPTLANMRAAYGRRFTGTPGVVASKGEQLGVSLQIDAIPAVPSARIDAALATLRELWETPDGWQYAGEAAGTQAWKCARQEAVGFYYVPDPWPPRDWLDARREWMGFARKICRAGKCDSDEEVAQQYPTAPELLAWREIEPTHKLTTRTVWLCDSVLQRAAEWMQTHPHGIVWTPFIAFGDALERMSGRKYYSNGGLASDGEYIEDAKGPVIASFESNRDGRNLQKKWHQNLFIACPKRGLQFEQSLGRTHRTGQLADVVTADVYLGVVEHLEAFWTAYAQSKYMQGTEQQPKKLVYADKTIPISILEPGPRWNKKYKKPQIDIRKAS